MRLKVFEGHSKSSGSKNKVFLIQGLQGSMGQRVQDMQRHILNLSPGHKRGSGANTSKNYRVSRAKCLKDTKDPRIQGFKG